MAALRPRTTVSCDRPSFSYRPRMLNLPEKTPIEPVMVPGCATIASPFIAM
jgi:hypothetical protein